MTNENASCEPIIVSCIALLLISPLTAQHFTLERIKEKTTSLARDLERLISDEPADTRSILRRFAEGNLGRLQVPGIDALGGSVTRNLERLAGAIAAADLVIGADTPSNTAIDPRKK